jgi:hypothetical protein
VGAPWELALGYVALTIRASCECGLFHFSVCLEGTYDFDPKWLKRHRVPDGELVTTLVLATRKCTCFRMEAVLEYKLASWIDVYVPGLRRRYWEPRIAWW